MEPIRILQIVPNMQAGGLESLIMNIYRNIDRNKVQFDFLVHYTEEKHFDKEIESLGGKIHRFSVREDNKLIKYIKSLDVFFKNHKEYKVIHCHMSSLGFLIFLIAKKNGVKVRIAHSHNSSTSKNIKGFVKRILMLPYKYISTINYACSNESGKYLYNKKEFEVIPNAIELKKYKFDREVRYEVRKELNLEADFVIGHVGRFNIQKNHEYLIDMFYEFIKLKPQSKLLLIGDGELKEEIKEKIEVLGINDKVLMLGVRSDIDRLYQAMDCFCLPSLFEGLPLVSIEAQTSGLPCFITDNITKEAEKTDLIKRIDLNNSPKTNAELICRSISNINREEYYDAIKNTNFNITKYSKKLQNKYIKYYRLQEIDNHVEVTINPNAGHCRQILAGYEMLYKKGIIGKLKVKKNYKLSKGLTLVKLGGKLLVYDTDDKSDVYYDEYLDKCDFYFKRSFVSNDIPSKYKNKIKNLGFNYYVDYSKQKIFGLNFIIQAILRKILGKHPYYVNIDKLQDIPSIKDNYPEVIFFTQLYDPNASDVENENVKKEREEINNFRVGCINKLKENFGEKIYIGLNDNTYTRRMFPELISSRKLTRKFNYLKLMRKCNICICTKGLHSSNGWRLGEYISSSKCILSEELYHEVPGNFRKNKNYLEFKTSDELIKQLEKILDCEQFKKDIMDNNYEYYNEYLKPDSLILNSLEYILLSLG